MKKVPVDKIRNLALLGHQDTGKTSFLEAALFTSWQVSRLARVDEGNSNLDFTPEEVERRLTVKAKLVAADWKGTRLHFVDSPGYDDFVAERLSAVAGVEAALVFVKSDADVEPGTERAWRLLDIHGKPLNGKEVYRKDVGGKPVITKIALETGKRYPVTITYFKGGSAAFWLEQVDIAGKGDLKTLTQKDGKFPYLLDAAGKWIVRNDVTYTDPRLFPTRAISPLSATSNNGKSIGP